jgi:hypothetical protein
MDFYYLCSPNTFDDFSIVQDIFVLSINKEWYPDHETKRWLNVPVTRINTQFDSMPWHSNDNSEEGE